MPVQSKAPKKSANYKRLPGLGKVNDAGQYQDVEYLAAWLFQYRYSQHCKRFDIKFADKKKDKRFKSVKELIAYFEKVAVKGKIPFKINLVALYHSNKKNDSNKDVEIIVDDCWERQSDLDSRLRKK